MLSPPFAGSFVARSSGLGFVSLTYWFSAPDSIPPLAFVILAVSLAFLEANFLGFLISFSHVSTSSGTPSFTWVSNIQIFSIWVGS